MRYYKKILKELKGEYTIKDLNFVTEKYIKFWWERHCFNGNKFTRSPKEKVPVSFERKEFDTWVIEYMQRYSLNMLKKEKDTNNFFLVLREKAKYNTLFVEFLNTVDIKKIEKDLNKFLEKFKGNFTKKFVEYQINKIMPYVWSYSSWHKEYNCFSTNYEYELEKEPVGLNKKEFNFWIIEQIKDYYKKNPYMKKEEIYAQFFLAFITRIIFEFRLKNISTIMKNFNKNFTIKSLIKVTYRYCPDFNFDLLNSDYYQLEKEPLSLNRKEFNLWIINQMKIFCKNNAVYHFDLQYEDQLFIALRLKVINKYKNSISEFKKVLVKNYRSYEKLNFLENNSQNYFFEKFLINVIKDQRIYIKNKQVKYNILCSWAKKNLKNKVKNAFEKEYIKNIKK